MSPARAYRLPSSIWGRSCCAARVGLVTRDQRGKWAYFALNVDAMNAAAEALRSV